MTKSSNPCALGVLRLSGNFVDPPRKTTDIWLWVKKMPTLGDHRFWSIFSFTNRFFWYPFLTQSHFPPHKPPKKHHPRPPHPRRRFGPGFGPTDAVFLVGPLLKRTSRVERAFATWSGRGRVESWRSSFFDVKRLRVL